MPVVLDVETTTFEKGDPFAQRNRLCYVGAYPQGGQILCGIDAFMPVVRDELAKHQLIIGCNLKFDLHWLRRCNVVLTPEQRVWDVQLAHYLLTNQEGAFPSLEDICQHYGLEGKLDTVKEYWDRGVDTPDIPADIVITYLAVDLQRTMQVYEKQVEDFKTKSKLYRLFQLQCRDLLVLAEMEWNGLRLDVDGTLQEKEKLEAQIEEIETNLRNIYPTVPINWDSGDHLSCYLYGGTIRIDRREIAGVYKSGAKVGEPRYRIITDEFKLPRKYDPIEGSELKKEGYWSTDESVLKRLGKGQDLQWVMERAKLMKSLDYFKGLPKLIEDKDWAPGELHGRFNQCVARTGRLSSAQPNLQNLTEDISAFLVSRN